MVRLITWNVARRVSVLAEQAAAVGERSPDVLALQEVTARTLPLWEAACAAIGLGHVACSLAGNGAIKPRTLAAVRAGLAGRSGPRVLCGDLNTPRREHPDGTVWSFARDGRGRLREARAGFWDESELGVVPGLHDLGFADAFRALNGYGSREPSWAFRHGGGWRLDHVFCSAELEPRACAYHHDWRLRGLSDHSALEAYLAYEPPSGP